MLNRRCYNGFFADNWDTIDWVIKNLKNNNGKVGTFGISYPGFYPAATIPDADPAFVLKDCHVSFSFF